ncbi:unnamed protein product [Lupinus luteus]|uniref:Uncharacterized protein n=1 Tax=Lupinus luteus TaxID=3873 RepID=A0AAV1XUA3_LUPLU
MGSTCKQGKPNGNKKREVTTLTLGRRRSKKRRLTQLKAIGRMNHLLPINEDDASRQDATDDYHCRSKSE